MMMLKMRTQRVLCSKQKLRVKMLKAILLLAITAHFIYTTVAVTDDCTGANEEYIDCYKGCTPQTCAYIGKKVNCPLEPADCVGACRCKSGYVEIDNTCTPVTQCTSCGGDPNARPGCGTNCGRLCSNYQNHVICPRYQCDNTGCDCKDGYVYDTDAQQCVLPDDCPKTSS
ncbi:inducible metalloproteinase inhibitor protein-like isoform X2 [Amyelois transitella]|uniref:inducible metalloproteinase inhibitor protein-like isoform X2 n=1 Tax=Amyelois transitella TaxID=680683 RepID=UPI0029903EB7|nr:inducible metalloproteinase inhibitor protein-like isoform X2 [Amyelois transitella]